MIDGGSGLYALSASGEPAGATDRDHRRSWREKEKEHEKRAVAAGRRRARDPGANGNEPEERKGSAKRRRPGKQRGLLATRVWEAAEHPKVQRLQGKGRRRSRRTVSLFFSCHGGSGSTILATTLAAMVARSGRRVCLVDLDLQFGDVLTALNLKARLPLSDVIAELKAAGDEGLDRSALRARLPRHESGAWVLSQVGCVEGLADVSPERLAAVLKQIRRAFEVTIIDGVRDFGDLPLAALDVADSVVMIATQDVPTLRGLAMRLDLFKRLGYKPNELYTVINRYSERGLVPVDAITESLQVEPSFLIANDFKTVHQALDDGEPLNEAAPKSRVTQDIELMADQLFEVPRAAQRHGLLQRLLGGRA